jgi:broad specificity phosphatase PhoE
MFGDTRLKNPVDDIYVSSTPATQATALPLAERLGIKPVVIEPGTPHAWARRVLEHRGGRILVITGANMARDLAGELSGVSDLPSIPPTELGTMYIVTVPRIGRANLLSVAY